MEKDISIPLFAPTTQLDFMDRGEIIWGEKPLSQPSPDLQGLAGVYRIRNKRNGKVYIGSTGDLYQRWREHLKDLRNHRHHAHHLQKAFNKYGISEFTFGVCIFFDDITRLNKIEQTFIIRYKSDFPSHGYNTQSFPMGAGNKPSPETRHKMAEAAKGKSHSLETRRKIGEASKGRTHSLEIRRKIAEAQMGRIHSLETRHKMSEAQKGEKNHNFGKTPNLEIRYKIGEAQKGKKNHNFGKSFSPETRHKMTEVMKARWQDPESRKILLEARKKGKP